MTLCAEIALAAKLSSQYYLGLWTQRLAHFFQSSRSRGRNRRHARRVRSPNPIVHPRRVPVIEKIVVTWAVASLFGCGAKNGAANDTTSADGAIKTPATVEQAAKV